MLLKNCLMVFTRKILNFFRLLAISNKKKQTIEENGKSKSLILKEGDNGVTNNNNQGVCKGC